MPKSGPSAGSVQVDRIVILVAVTKSEKLAEPVRKVAPLASQRARNADDPVAVPLARAAHYREPVNHAEKPIGTNEVRPCLASRIEEGFGTWFREASQLRFHLI